MTNNNNITALKNLTLSSSLFCPDSQETPMASYLSPHLISLSRRNLAPKSLSFRLKSEIETFHNYENSPMDCRFYWSNNFRDWRWEVWRNLKPSVFFLFAAKKKEMKKELMLFNGKILVTLILPPKFSDPYNKGNRVLFAWVRQWTFVSVSWILFAIIQLVPFDLEINCITQKYDLKLPSMKSALSELKASLSAISWNKIQ